MPMWKILVIMLLGCVCLTLALATVIVPMTLVLDWTRWVWLAGLFASTVCMGTLFRLFLNRADRDLGSYRK